GGLVLPHRRRSARRGRTFHADPLVRARAEPDPRKPVDLDPRRRGRGLRRAPGAGLAGQPERHGLERRGSSGRRAAPGGRGTAAGLYPGSYRIRVEVPGYLPYNGTFELPPDLETGVLSEEIVLRPGNTLRVEVVGSDDKPYRGSAETVLLKDGVEIHRSYGRI